MATIVTQVEPEVLKARVDRFRAAEAEIVRQVRRVIVGQEEVLEQVLIALFVGGHCLITGLPGTAKTLLVRTLATTLGLDFKRIQFTPDLMPSDITGTDIIEEDPSNGRRTWTFVQGPIFANVLLADEINRTPPKTQSALLEAMQEHACTVRGTRYSLPEPFFVLATQNPIELEGTYPLPEAQLDRFLFKVEVPFLNRSELNDVVMRTILKRPTEPKKLLDSERILGLRKVLDKVVVADPIRDYAVRLVLSTHPGTDFATDEIRKYVRWGASPRAAQALIRAARVRALSQGRAHAGFDDVRHFAASVLQHRVLLNYDGQAENMTTPTLIRQCVERLSEEQV
jgi:MoxR-like ATPase